DRETVRAASGSSASDRSCVRSTPVPRDCSECRTASCPPRHALVRCKSIGREVLFENSSPPDREGRSTRPTLAAFRDGRGTSALLLRAQLLTRPLERAVVRHHLADDRLRRQA